PLEGDCRSFRLPALRRIDRSGRRKRWLRSRSLDPLVRDADFAILRLVRVREGVFSNPHSRKRQRRHLQVIDNRQSLQPSVAGKLTPQVIKIAGGATGPEMLVEIGADLLPRLPVPR